MVGSDERGMGDASTSHARYSAPYQTTVAFEKLKRRQVERDAVALRNRLRQLEREAEKVDKKIARTKQRAKEVVTQRERNEHRESDRQRYLEELQEQVEKHREEIARCRSLAAAGPYARLTSTLQRLGEWAAAARVQLSSCTFAAPALCAALL